jgi:sortase A
MPPAGTKPNYRKFSRRRRRAGFGLLASLAVVVFGALLLARMALPDLQLSALRGAQKSPVERVESPSLAGAPEAVAEQEQSPEESASRPADRPEPAALPVPPTNDLWMSIPALGLYDNYVTNSAAQSAMDYGAIKLPHTAFPWQENANTYIAAHRLGWPGTPSYRQFYNLPLLAKGDVIYLGDVNGTTYTYEVTGFKEITPDETWVTTPQPGRDMVSLQTCIENFGDYWTMGPNWYVRYIVQADRVSVDPAA